MTHRGNKQVKQQKSPFLGLHQHIVLADNFATRLSTRRSTESHVLHSFRFKKPPVLSSRQQYPEQFRRWDQLARERREASKGTSRDASVENRRDTVLVKNELKIDTKEITQIAEIKRIKGVEGEPSFERKNLLVLPEEVKKPAQEKKMNPLYNFVPYPQLSVPTARSKKKKHC